jgi:hypothetical protein
VVDDLGIQPITMTQVQGVNSLTMSPVFLVDFVLPMGVTIGAINATLGALSPGVDVLIGMDVINLGDFVVTNKNGRTRMSFRVPSQWSTDFVAMITQANTGRAQPAGTPPRRKRRK